MSPIVELTHIYIHEKKSYQIWNLICYSELNISEHKNNSEGSPAR